ncbi:hypothetical protein, partial [Streptosporangium carneum]|uniref:hypothetical protein n=1 Tax=Streptosporangium carneum TaxID=47481 RepID=UPI0031E81C73
MRKKDLEPAVRHGQASRRRSGVRPAGAAGTRAGVAECGPPVVVAPGRSAGNGARPGTREGPGRPSGQRRYGGCGRERSLLRGRGGHGREGLLDERL